MTMRWTSFVPSPISRFYRDQKILEIADSSIEP